MNVLDSSKAIIAVYNNVFHVISVDSLRYCEVRSQGRLGCFSFTLFSLMARTRYIFEGSIRGFIEMFWMPRYLFSILRIRFHHRHFLLLAALLSHVSCSALLFFVIISFSIFAMPASSVPPSSSFSSSYSPLCYSVPSLSSSSPSAVPVLLFHAANNIVI